MDQKLIYTTLIYNLRLAQREDDLSKEMEIAWQLANDFDKGDWEIVSLPTALDLSIERYIRRKFLQFCQDVLSDKCEIPSLESKITGFWADMISTYQWKFDFFRLFNRNSNFKQLESRIIDFFETFRSICINLIEMHYTSILNNLHALDVTIWEQYETLMIWIEQILNSLEDANDKRIKSVIDKHKMSNYLRIPQMKGIAASNAISLYIIDLDSYKNYHQFMIDLNSYSDQVSQILKQFSFAYHFEDFDIYLGPAFKNSLPMVIEIIKERITQSIMAQDREQGVKLRKQLIACISFKSALDQGINTKDEMLIVDYSVDIVDIFLTEIETQRIKALIPTVMKEITQLSRQLRISWGNRDHSVTQLLETELVSKRIDLCRGLKPRNANEIENLRAYFTYHVKLEYMSGEFSATRRCWFCKTRLTGQYNDECRDCHWWVCICGACKDPVSWGVKHKGSVCHEQILRLGKVHHDILTEWRISDYKLSGAFAKSEGPW